MPDTRHLPFSQTLPDEVLADLIEHTTSRMERLKMFRENNGGWGYDYNGIDRTLAGLSVDWANRRVTFPPAMPRDQQRFLETLFFQKVPQRGKVRAFEVRWLGALVDRYRDSKTRIIFFQPPRGPAPRRRR